MTVYCIRYGKSSIVLLIFANNNIPLTFINYHSDIEDSIICEIFLDDIFLNLVKKICKNTGKLAILNNNHDNADVSKISKLVMGSNIIWKNYSLKKWNNFINSTMTFSRKNNVRIDITHPIDFNDKKINNLIESGLKIRNKEKIIWKK